MGVMILKRVDFLRQWTIPTKSDHLALAVKVKIRSGRKSRWVDLTLITANMGGRFDALDLEKLFRHAGPDSVIGLQEGGDRPWVKRVAEAAGYTYIGGTGDVGQKSTPTLVGPGVDVRLVRWQRLLGRLFVGSGAGPDFSKPKWWTRPRLRLKGVPFGASSWHLLASQQKPLRMRLAKVQAGPVLRALRKIRRPFFLLGDINSDHDQPLARWLADSGLLTNHDVLGEIATRGHRSIDVVAVQRRLVRR